MSLQIDERLARSLVDAQFPHWSHLPLRQVDLDGWDNRTFRLGDDLSVRLPSGDWYALQVAKEQRWLPVLAPQLPLPIPVPVAAGVPAPDYPHPWSVYRWIDGTPAASAPPADPVAFASALAGFLVALRAVDATDGPEPGEHNFFRGGPLSTYADETERSIAALGAEIDVDGAHRVWDDGMQAGWSGEPVWFHGDIAVGNLLLRDGALAAVIDFGTSGVRDPACDVVLSWTLLTGAARTTFRSGLDLDRGTWARGRGWALWKALISLVGALDNGSEPDAAANRLVIERVLADFVAQH